MSNWSIAAAIQNAACKHLDIGCRDNYTQKVENTVKKTDDTISFKIPKQEAKDLNVCDIDLSRDDITGITVERPHYPYNGETYLMTVEHAPHKDYGDTEQLTEYCAVDGGNYEYGTREIEVAEKYHRYGDMTTSASLAAGLYKDTTRTITKGEKPEGLINNYTQASKTSHHRLTKQDENECHHQVKEGEYKDKFNYTSTPDRPFVGSIDKKDYDVLNEVLTPHYVCTEDHDCKVNWFATPQNTDGQLTWTWED